MQMSAPEAVVFDQEKEHVKALYGIGEQRRMISVNVCSPAGS